MLVAYHFFLFLEITDDLGQGFLQNLNLVLVGLDLSGLLLCSHLILLFGTLVDGDVTLYFLVSFLVRFNLLLLLIQFVPLRDRLQSQILVLFMDLTLNCQDSYIR